jgi:prophage antirepressor-like protein
MTSDIITIEGVRGYIDENGTAQLNLEDCAIGLGFTEIAASGNKCIRWRTVRKYLSEFNIATSCDDEKAPDFIPENIFYRLCMKAKNENAEKFQSKVADEILPQIRKTGSYSAKPLSTLDAFEMQVKIMRELEQKQREQERIQQEQSKRLAAVEQQAENTARTMTASTTNWRSDCKQILQLIADKQHTDLRPVYVEAYKLLELRAGVRLEQRKSNIASRIKANGYPVSKPISKLDAIEQDKKLIEIFVSIVREMAFRYGVCADSLGSLPAQIVCFDPGDVDIDEDGNLPCNSICYNENEPY